MNEASEKIERGMAFLKSKGLSNDYEQAFYWLDKARELGSKEAEQVIQDMRMRNLGTPFSGDIPEPSRRSSDGKSSDEFEIVNQTSTPENARIDIEAGIGKNFEVSRDKCVACGAEALIPNTNVTGAKYCSPSKKGCGASVMLPIIEKGLDNGIALQAYSESVSSGRERVYSSLGALVHMIKYDARIDDALRVKIISEIVNRINECGIVEQVIDDSLQNITIVPAPSSKKRKVQPVTLLAQLISKSGYEFIDALTKKSSIESKNRQSGTELDLDDVTCSDDISGKTVLLIDDTYGEGATLRACIHALRGKGARKVYFLSLCKNIFGGMKGSTSDDDDIH